jgi:tetratricopeptide (TPR) repeat protein
MQDTRDNFRDLAAKAVRLHESGRLDSAAAAYHEILALHPQHAAALQNLGIIAAVQGEHRSAIAYFDKALAVDDRYLPAHFHRAISLEALGKADDAINGSHASIPATTKPIGVWGSCGWQRATSAGPSIISAAPTNCAGARTDRAWRPAR